ncbi:hypothetical protein [Sinomonas sp.]|uniref:hypothetical protein n=1 Tax=Sinomonas sp. TaxID=1914986 RepID=UPI002FE2BD36
MISRDELEGLLVSGGTIVAADGTQLGSVDQLVLDGSGTVPVFVAVRAGFFGISQRFVPLDGATLAGSTLTVAFDADAVRSAPRVASDRGGLSADQAREVRTHYGLESADATGSGDGSGSRSEPAAKGAGEFTAGQTGQAAPQGSPLAADHPEPLAHPAAPPPRPRPSHPEPSHPEPSHPRPPQPGPPPPPPPHSPHP